MPTGVSVPHIGAGFFRLIRVFVVCPALSSKGVKVQAHSVSVSQMQEYFM